MPNIRQTLFTACLLVPIACSSMATQPPEINPEHPLLGMLQAQPAPASLSATTLLSLHWAFPLALKKNTDEVRNVESCDALLDATLEGFGPSQPSEHGLIQANVALCQATAESQNLKASSQSFLPNPLLGPNFPEIAPAELAIAISNSDQKRNKQSSSWQEFSGAMDYQSAGPFEATYTTEDGAIQRVFLLGTGDINDDGIRDAILYLESALTTGSYSAARYLIITRNDDDGPMRVLENGFTE